MSDDLFNGKERCIDRAVADADAADLLPVLLEQDICCRRDHVAAVDHIVLDAVCGRNLQGCACDDGIQFSGPDEMLLVSHAAERLIDFDIILIGEIIAELSDYLDHFADVIVIMAVVIINTIMSLIQEAKAEDAMDALMQMTASTSKVLRDGEMVVIKSEDIVLGDVIIYEAGDTVPADCRILESHSLAPLIIGKSV